MSETTHAEVSREAYCQYCGGKLRYGFNFVCHVCGDTYCYMHMAKHSRAHARHPIAGPIYAS